MKYQLRGPIVHLSGILDETFSPTKFLDLLGRAEDQGMVKVDFAETKYASSAGLLHWLKALEEFGDPIVYLNCPKWLVNQFNMVPQLISEQNLVESIEIPFYNAELEKEICEIFTLNSDLPVRACYEEYELKPLIRDEAEFLPDIIPEKYFSFIKVNKELFTQQVSN